MSKATAEKSARTTEKPASQYPGGGKKQDLEGEGERERGISEADQADARRVKTGKYRIGVLRRISQIQIVEQVRMNSGQSLYRVQPRIAAQSQIMMPQGPKKHQRENEGKNRSASPQSVAGQPVKAFRRKRNGFV